VESTRFETVNEAVSWAQERALRQRAVCYVTRGWADQVELLVLRHEPQPTDSWIQPGVQLPAGGVDPGETPAQAAVREVFEETGLSLSGEAVHLGSCHWSGAGWTGPGQVWHYFQLTASPSTLDAWDHRVTGGEDTDMLFHLSFAPLSAHELTPGQGSHEYLPELFELLGIQPVFDNLADARTHAQFHSLREKAVCQVTRGHQLLVFDHVPDDSGVQVPAGGVEPGETSAQAASRECAEETGHSGYSQPVYLGSAVWINTEHAKREMRHFFHLLAPPDLPDTWEHDADEHRFRFRWVPLAEPHLDWSFDLILPVLLILQEPAHD
jgi:8-oxo-dGTP pyrophosphatase MutT (NUDIX family)